MSLRRRLLLSTVTYLLFGVNLSLQADDFAPPTPCGCEAQSNAQLSSAPSQDTWLSILWQELRLFF